MRFATDDSLGRLGRYLRAAGFDTLCAHQQPRADFFARLAVDRIVLTRTRSIARRLSGRRMIFIKNNDPWRQLAQVVRQMNLGPADLRPFSRCLQCNQALQAADRAAVQSRVPAYVWQAHAAFYRCAQCGRVYWAGTHRERMANGLASLFHRKGHRACRTPTTFPTANAAAVATDRVPPTPKTDKSANSYPGSSTSSS